MKIGLLTDSTISAFRLNTLKPILKDPAFSIRLAVIDDRPVDSAIKKLKKNIKRGRGGFVLIMALQKLFAKKENHIPTKAFCQDHGISVVRTLHPYAPETLEIIRQYDLDLLLLIGGYGIVKEPLLETTPLGVLSYHHGNMRTYRGMPPALWELYNGEQEMGITVQILAPGIDCGIPIEEKTIVIYPKDNLRQLEKRALRESEGMLYQALKKLADPDFKPQSIETLGKVYTLPNLKQWITLQLRIWSRKLTLSF